LVMEGHTVQIEIKTRWKSIVVAVASDEGPPFPVDAEVFEEDTYLALSADPEFRPSTEHPLRVLSEAAAAQPERPGTVVVKSGRPLRMLAIVHQLDKDPTWREDWVASALEAVFVQVERRDLQSISLPLLGTVHGKLNVERSLALLSDSLHRLQHTPLDRIWLKPGQSTPEDISNLLSKGD
jgi:hypothetical protein